MNQNKLLSLTEVRSLPDCSGSECMFIFFLSGQKLPLLLLHRNVIHTGVQFTVLHILIEHIGCSFETVNHWPDVEDQGILKRNKLQQRQALFQRVLCIYRCRSPKCADLQGLLNALKALKAQDRNGKERKLDIGAKQLSFV